MHNFDCAIRFLQNRCTHLRRGRIDDGADIAQLEQAVEMRAGPVYAIRGSFLFASLRGHPRYNALMERLGLGEDAELPGGSLHPASS